MYTKNEPEISPARSCQNLNPEKFRKHFRTVAYRVSESVKNNFKKVKNKNHFIVNFIELEDIKLTNGKFGNNFTFIRCFLLVLLTLTN